VLTGLCASVTVAGRLKGTKTPIRHAATG